MNEADIQKLYPCPYCGTPTTGQIIGMKNKKLIRTMCQGCKDYIGSPAAHQEGATMQNRIEMEAQYNKLKVTDA